MASLKMPPVSHFRWRTAPHAGEYLICLLRPQTHFHTSKKTSNLFPKSDLTRFHFICSFFLPLSTLTLQMWMTWMCKGTVVCVHVCVTLSIYSSASLQLNCYVTQRHCERTREHTLTHRPRSDLFFSVKSLSESHMTTESTPVEYRRL